MLYGCCSVYVAHSLSPFASAQYSRKSCAYARRAQKIFSLVSENTTVFGQCEQNAVATWDPSRFPPDKNMNVAEWCCSSLFGAPELFFLCVSPRLKCRAWPSPLPPLTSSSAAVVWFCPCALSLSGLCADGAALVAWPTGGTRKLPFRR